MVATLGGTMRCEKYRSPLCTSYFQNIIRNSVENDILKMSGAKGVHWGGGRGLWMDFIRPANDLLTIGKRLYLVSSASRQILVNNSSRYRQKLDSYLDTSRTHARMGENFAG